MRWSERDGAVLARRRRRLGRPGARRQTARPADAEMPCAGDARRRALWLRSAALPWTDELTTWRHRVVFLRRHDPSWPELRRRCSQSLEDWLLPFLDGLARRDHLPGSIAVWRLQDAGALGPPAPARSSCTDARRGAERLARADRLRQPGDADLAVRLQEMFGLTRRRASPAGMVPLTIHLLSPARRPVQVTRDPWRFWDQRLSRGEGRAWYAIRATTGSMIRSSPNRRRLPRGR